MKQRITTWERSSCVLTWVWMRLSPLNQRICPLLSSLSAWSISSFSSFTSSSWHSSFWVNWPALRRKRNLLLGMVAITWPTEKTEYCVRRQADKLPAQRRTFLIDGERELNQEKQALRENRKKEKQICMLPVPRQALPARGKHTTSTFPGPEVDSWMASLQTAQSQSAQSTSTSTSHEST